MRFRDQLIKKCPTCKETELWKSERRIALFPRVIVEYADYECRPCIEKAKVPPEARGLEFVVGCGAPTSGTYCNRLVALEPAERFEEILPFVENYQDVRCPAHEGVPS